VRCCSSAPDALGPWRGLLQPPHARPLQVLCGGGDPFDLFHLPHHLGPKVGGRVAEPYARRLRHRLQRHMAGGGDGGGNSHDVGACAGVGVPSRLTPLFFLLSGPGSNAESEFPAVAFSHCARRPAAPPRPPAAKATPSTDPVIQPYDRLPSALTTAEEEEHNDISSSDLTLPPPPRRRSYPTHEDPEPMIVTSGSSGLPRDPTVRVSPSPDA
jgi:hypothetical protein